MVKHSKKATLHTAYTEDGKLASPVLDENKKNFLIDIDGTICEDIPNEEPERMLTARVFPDALEMCNKWFDEGHIITFFTSRTLEHKEVTEKWLDASGFRYHSVLYGKPRGGNYHWIDNHIVKATHFKGKFTNMVTEMKPIEVFED
jgi:hypothetical protein